MIYRAKCTHILDVLDWAVDLKSYNIIKICQDTYIEVSDKDFAGQIDLLEETMEKVRLQALRLKDMFG